MTLTPFKSTKRPTLIRWLTDSANSIFKCKMHIKRLARSQKKITLWIKLSTQFAGCHTEYSEYLVLSSKTSLCMNSVLQASGTVAYTGRYVHIRLLYLPTKAFLGYTACRFLLTASIGGFRVIWISRLYCSSGFKRLRVSGLSITFK